MHLRLRQAHEGRLAVLHKGLLGGDDVLLVQFARRMHEAGLRERQGLHALSVRPQQLLRGVQRKAAHPGDMAIPARRSHHRRPQFPRSNGFCREFF